MIIEMLETRKGSPDGKSIVIYEENERYYVPEDISLDLAEVYLKNRWARKCDAKNSGPSGEHKDAGPAPKNKSLFRKVVARVKGK